MAGLTTVDAHQHVWSLERGDYGWLTPALGPIYRDCTQDDYRAIAPPSVAASVLVQAAPTVAETRFLLDAANASRGAVCGVVGWVDLDADDASDALARLARDPMLKGVRPMLQDLPDGDWILRPRVGVALGAMARLHLRFDALVTPRQMPALVTMLERHPDLQVVLDHAGKPPIASGAREPWTALLRAVAAHPAVCCKLSGLATEAGPGWSAATLRPWTDTVFECFGAGRVMWGSDWPVVERGGGLACWWATTQALLEPLDANARQQVLGGTARRFYGV